MDHHNHHHQNPLQPPPFTVATDPPPPYFTGFIQPPPSHPSYTEMITAAIMAEGKEGGVSKRSIEKYIERVYTNLQPSHSFELTQFLKELTHNGYLVMIKNCYQLASSVVGAAGVPANPAPSHTGSAPHELDLNSSQHFQQQQQLAGAGFVDPGLKRRPGRPPRARTEPALGQAQSQENGGGAGAGEGGAQSGAVRKRGRPPKQQVLQPHGGQAEHQIVMEPTDIQYVQPMPQPELITSMDGLGVDEEGKRGPGRPPKLTPQRKAAQVNGSAQLVEGSDQAVVVVKRKRGRPARTSLGGGLEGGGGKPRGRPKRSGLGPVSRPVGKRPRGRPPRGGGGGAVVVGKRRGRPRKVGGVPPKVRRLSASGKPMGRPRKSAASLNQVSKQTTNEELTKKLDLFQSKIRDAIDVLRPYIPHENAPLMALQQLEQLAAPPVPVTATPLAEIAPMPVNMNAPPPPTGTVSGPPPESESAPYMNLAGPFSVTVPFQVPSGFDNQQRMSWMSSNEAQS